jgi:hypothetical protein
MFDNFLIGFLAGIFFLIKFICAVAMVWIAAMPVVSILVCGASGWWMLSYLLIVPIYCGIFNMFYD